MVGEIDRVRHELLVAHEVRIMFLKWCLFVWACFSPFAAGIEKNTPSLLPSTCGETAGSDRIIGGKETALDAYPWLVLVEFLVKKTQTVTPLCGGSLITNRHVLTAGHCVVMDTALFSDPLNIRLGEHDLRTDVDCQIVDDEGNEDCNDPAVVVPVASYTKHPDFKLNDQSRHGDIAIIKMERDVQFTDFIKPICITSSDANDPITEVFAAGWGKTERAYRSEVKLDIKTKIVNRSICQQTYTKYKVTLFDGQLCAGGEKGHDTCTGDSGGPLMVYSVKTRRWKLVGIISFGPNKCGTKGFPAVYTNVKFYLNWILQNLNS